MTQFENDEHKTLIQWLIDMVGAKPHLLGEFYPDAIILPPKVEKVQDLREMRGADEQAELFHRLLRINTEKSADEGYEELLGLAKAVGWLHTERCLPALLAV